MAQAPPRLEPEPPVTEDQIGAATYRGVFSTLLLTVTSPPTASSNVERPVPFSAAWYATPRFWDIRQEEVQWWA